MCEQNYEIIKTRNISLKAGEPSDEIVLVDKEGSGDMYFTFCLQYLNGKDNGQTQFNVKDSHHADFIIETTPYAITGLPKPVQIGTYGPSKIDLYLNFKISPRAITDGTHDVNIIFYTKKK